MPETSNLTDFIAQGTRTTLVEADPDVCQKIIHQFIDGNPAANVTLHPVAVWHKEGTLQLARAAASTFATELPASPALHNDNFRVRNDNTFSVPCKTFNQIDDGTIDLISIDIEGGEWYVLQKMTSRPQVISIETHGKSYTNPFLQEITHWMQQNQYQIWYQDGSDTVYYRQGILIPSEEDKASVKEAGRKLKIEKLKKKIKNWLGLS